MLAFQFYAELFALVIFRFKVEVQIQITICLVFVKAVHLFLCLDVHWKSSP